MFIGMRLFCAFFLIGCCNSGTVPKKTRHRIKGIPLSVWRVFFAVSYTHLTLPTTERV